MRVFRNADRFYNYRQIAAKFASRGTCGHEIAKGDNIGYHPTTKNTFCPACWDAWCAENAAAEADERQYASCY